MLQQQSWFQQILERMMISRDEIGNSRARQDGPSENSTRAEDQQTSAELFEVQQVEDQQRLLEVSENRASEETRRDSSEVAETSQLQIDTSFQETENLIQQEFGSSSQLPTTIGDCTPIERVLHECDIPRESLSDEGQSAVVELCDQNKDHRDELCDHHSDEEIAQNANETRKLYKKYNMLVHETTVALYLQSSRYEKVIAAVWFHRSYMSPKEIAQLISHVTKQGSSKDPLVLTYRKALTVRSSSKLTNEIPIIQTSLKFKEVARYGDLNSSDESWIVRTSQGEYSGIDHIDLIHIDANDSANSHFIKLEGDGLCWARAFLRSKRGSTHFNTQWSVTGGYKTPSNRSMKPEIIKAMKTELIETLEELRTLQVQDSTNDFIDLLENLDFPEEPNRNIWRWHNAELAAKELDEKLLLWNTAKSQDLSDVVISKMFNMTDDINVIKQMIENKDIPSSTKSKRSSRVTIIDDEISENHDHAIASKDTQQQPSQDPIEQIPEAIEPIQSVDVAEIPNDISIQTEEIPMLPSQTNGDVANMEVTLQESGLSTRPSEIPTQEMLIEARESQLSHQNNEDDGDHQDGIPNGIQPRRSSINQSTQTEWRYGQIIMLDVPSDASREVPILSPSQTEALCDVIRALIDRARTISNGGPNRSSIAITEETARNLSSWLSKETTETQSKRTQPHKQIRSQISYSSPRPESSTQNRRTGHHERTPNSSLSSPKKDIWSRVGKRKFENDTPMSISDLRPKTQDQTYFRCCEPISEEWNAPLYRPESPSDQPRTNHSSQPRRDSEGPRRPFVPEIPVNPQRTIEVASEEWNTPLPNSIDAPRVTGSVIQTQPEPPEQTPIPRGNAGQPTMSREDIDFLASFDTEASNIYPELRAERWESENRCQRATQERVRQRLAAGLPAYETSTPEQYEEFRRSKKRSRQKERRYRNRIRKYSRETPEPEPYPRIRVG